MIIACDVSFSGHPPTAGRELYARMVEQMAEQFSRIRPALGQKPIFANPRAVEKPWKEQLHPRDHGKFTDKSAKTGSGPAEEQGELFPEEDKTKTPGEKPPAQPAAAAPAPEPKPKDEVIGKGSTGDVTKRGDRVYKNASKTEGKVYAALAGVEGVADGKQEGNEISTPHFQYVISRDTVDPKSRKGMAPLVKRNIGRITNALTALSQAGYSYNDPLQVGLDSEKRANLFDFSMAEKTTPEAATRENLSHLSNFYEEFGLPRMADAVLGVAFILDYTGNKEAREFSDQEPDAIAAGHILNALGGKQPKYAYFSFNKRTIPGVAQV